MNDRRCHRTTNHAEHWNEVYGTKRDQDVSWFESVPAVSIRMMEEAGLTAHTCVVDVGGGNSRLVDVLLRRGLDCVAVLDVSAVALTAARHRLGLDAERVTWIAADVAGSWSLKPMDMWHDRAVFHFLTTSDDRAGYMSHLRDTLKVGGSAVIATFALDGPEKCSGLPVVRYSPDTLAAELGPGFTLVHTEPCEHSTPWGARQSFHYCRFRRE